MFAEHREPAVLGTAGRAFGEDQCIVLVGREQALAAPRRPEHGERVRCGGGPCPSASILRSASTAARRVIAPSWRETMAAMSRPQRPSREQAGGDRLDFGPGACELGRGLGVADVVAEEQRALRAQAQKIARRQRADHRAGVVDDAEMADAQAVHPPDRHIGEGIGINHRERL